MSFKFFKDCSGYKGIPNPSGSACCAKKCGKCGGSGCSKRPGGKKNCCTGNIKRLVDPTKKLPVDHLQVSLRKSILNFLTFKKNFWLDISFESDFLILYHSIIQLLQKKLRTLKSPRIPKI